MSIHEQRNRLRGEIPRRYSPAFQLVLLHAVAGGLLVAGGPYLARASVVEWAILPAIFVLGNLLEWWLHRGPLHHPKSPLRGLRRHSSYHHAYFSREHLAIVDARDLYLVLHPWWTTVLVLIVHLPPAVGLWVLVSPSAGVVLYLSLYAYFLLYEWLHVFHHLPAASSLASLPGLRFLRRHHAMHHDTRAIRSLHCNVSFPLWDFLLGTHSYRRKSG